MSDLEEFLEAFEKVVMYLNILDSEEIIKKLTAEQYEQLRQLINAYDDNIHQWGNL